MRRDFAQLRKDLVRVGTQINTDRVRKNLMADDDEGHVLYVLRTVVQRIDAYHQTGRPYQPEIVLRKDAPDA